MSILQNLNTVLRDIPLINLIN